MKWTIDRFEEDFAVIECNNKYFNIPKNVLPSDLCEGDILEITLNVAETKSKKDNLNNRLKNLFGE
ncbi:MAG: DUF3006 domain-containing protein [Clostridia bacterium]|nr:DUF3006 domain-containing protein [Clostridia bacterium]